MAADLRSLILEVHKKLGERFDHLESRLDHLGKQLASSQVEPTTPARRTSGCTPGLSAFTSLSARLRPSSAGLPLSEPTQPVPLELAKPAVEPLKTEAVFVNLACDAAEEASKEKPQQFTLRKEWDFHLKSWMTASLKVEGAKTEPLDFEQDEAKLCMSWKVKPWYIIWPTSRFRLTWDVMTMALVAHDMAVIPVHLGFGIDDNAFTTFFTFPFLFFWTTDIPLTFFTAYFVKGNVEMSLLKIAKNYILSWFMLDLSIVCCSWTEVFIRMDAEGLQLGRAGKILRVLQIGRSMRLLRLVKLRRIIEDIEDRITSECFHIVMVVSKLSIFIIWTNHFIACAWWWLGDSGPRQGEPDATLSWTSHFQMQDNELPYQYFTALHWSLTQFTPASMEITPRNVGERVFAVCVLFFAMIAFSSFVSSITTAMTQLRNLSNPVAKHFVTLRRYLHSRSIPSDLSHRITRCVTNGLKSTKTMIPESNVELLKFLSPPLYLELMWRVHGPVIMNHPFFSNYAEMDPIGMEHVCLKAVRRLNLCAGDILFSEACAGDSMYFVTGGALHYGPPQKMQMQHNPSGETESHPVDSRPLRSLNSTLVSRSHTSHSLGLGLKNSHDSDGSRPILMHGCTTQNPHNLVWEGNLLSNSKGTCVPYHASIDNAICEGEWICEPALWCCYSHGGRMTVITSAEVLAVDAAEVAKVTKLRRLVLQPSKRYGEAYVQRLNVEACDGYVSDVNAVPTTVVRELADMAFKSSVPS